MAESIVLSPSSGDIIGILTGKEVNSGKYRPRLWWIDRAIARSIWITEVDIFPELTDFPVNIPIINFHSESNALISENICLDSLYRFELNSGVAWIPSALLLLLIIKLAAVMVTVVSIILTRLKAPARTTGDQMQPLFTNPNRLRELSLFVHCAVDMAKY